MSSQDQNNNSSKAKSSKDPVAPESKAGVNTPNKSSDKDDAVPVLTETVPPNAEAAAKSAKQQPSPTSTGPSSTSPTSTNPTSTAPANESPGNKSPAKETPSKPKVEQKPEKKSGKASGNSSGRGKAFAFIVVLLVILAALLAGGWWGYRYLDQYLADQLSRSEQASAEQVQREVQRLSAELTQEREMRQQAMADLQQTTDAVSNRLNSQSQRLRELSGTTRSDWLLAEAEYLIRLGIQRFITERNTANSIALLESADQILSQLDEVDLLPVRRSLARDITTLRLINNIDREGLYLRLNALAEAVMTLPLIPLQAEQVPTQQSADSASQQPLSWQQQLQANFVQMLGKMQQLITVRKRNEEIKPLLSLEEEVYIRQNLRFMIEQAQLALLREEQLVYSDSLAKSASWLKDYFQLTPQAEEIVEELNGLGQQNIQVDYPDIGGGLNALRSYIDNWHRRYSIDKQRAGESQTPAETQTLQPQQLLQPSEVQQ